MTPTASQTPSPSTVPDVLLFFAVSLVPLQGGLTVSNVVALPAFLQSSAAAFAALINVPAPQVYAVNVSDAVTGAFTSVGTVRRLGGAGAGPKGIAVTYVARLGKTPTESTVNNITSILSSPTLSASTIRAVAASLCAATGLGAGAFSVSVPASGITLANSPFVLGTTVVVEASSSGGSGSASTGGIVGGILCALALACSVWAFRSWSKHGVLPCCRDRRRELLVRRSANSEAVEVTSALAEAERVLEHEADAVAASAAAAAPGVAPALPRPAKGSKADVVKRLVAKAERDRAEKASAAAEVAQLRKQLAEAKKADDEGEVAELRRQLASAKQAAQEQELAALRATLAAHQAQASAAGAHRDAFPPQALS